MSRGREKRWVYADLWKRRADFVTSVVVSNRNEGDGERPAHAVAAPCRHEQRRQLSRCSSPAARSERTVPVEFPRPAMTAVPIKPMLRQVGGSKERGRANASPKHAKSAPHAMRQRRPLGARPDIVSEPARIADDHTLKPLRSSAKQRQAEHDGPWLCGKGPLRRPALIRECAFPAEPSLPTHGTAAPLQVSAHPLHRQ